MKRIILASQSPRRAALLDAMGVAFETVPSSFEEKLDNARDPVVVAKELALGKAMDVALRYPDAYVIGSDTIVTIDGEQLEKPVSSGHAHEMLKRLGGRENYVTTGLAVVCLNENVRLLDADTTTVHFPPYDEAAVRAYVATGDPMDKAGAYGVQKLIGTLITRIEGSLDTVVGLPTAKLAELCQRVGIDAKALSDEEIRRVTA